MKKSSAQKAGARADTTLRKRAEAIAHASDTDVGSMSPKDIQRLVFELQVHQLELELQNEELRDTQAQLQESRDRYADLYDFAPVGYISVDNGGIVLEANFTACSMLGVERESLLGSKFSSFVVPESQDTSYLYWRDVFATSHRRICELKLCRPDDTFFTVRLESIIRKTPDLPSPQCLVALIDVSDIKEARDALSQLNVNLQDRVSSQLEQIELLAKAMEGLGEGVIIATNHGDWLESEIVFANDAMCRMAEYKKEELIGQTPRKLLEDCIDAVQSKTIRKALSEEHFFSGEMTCRRGDNGTYDTELLVSPMYDQKQERTHYVSVHRDISSRRRAEAALRNREERLQAILNTAPDGIITIDSSGVMLDCNPAAEGLFGFSAAEMLGNNVNMLMPAPYRDEHDSYLHRYQETGEPRIIGSRRQLSGRHRDGHTFPITLFVSAVDHLNLYLGVIRDDTEVRKLQREVLLAAGKIQWSIGQALHDGPQQALAGLGLQTRGLALDLERDSSPYASEAMELSNKLQKTNKEIRSLARGLVPVRVGSGSFMSALENLARRTCEGDRLTCEFQCIEPIHIEDDFTADQLYHIASEATINAVKHAGADHILISLSWEKKTISLKVTDNGRGFDKNSIDNSGLGLQIMAHRAATIGAEFSILSEEGGGGTQVTCRLVSVKDRSRQQARI